MSEIRVTTNNFIYAAAYQRLLAFLIDAVIVNLLLLLFMSGYWIDWSNLLGNLSNWQSFDWLVFLKSSTFIAFLVAPIIYISLVAGFFSRTFGMMFMKIRIANLDGSRIGWLKAFLYALSNLVAEIPLLLGYLPILFNKKHQGLHNMISQTMVIVKR